MKTTITVRVEPTDKQRLNAIANEDRRTVSFIANEMIREGLNRHEQNRRGAEGTEAGTHILPVLESKQTPTNGSSNS